MTENLIAAVLKGGMMPTDPRYIEQISACVDVVRSSAAGMTIEMVANVRSSPEDHGDYLETSVTTEYFTSFELRAMMSGFRENGLFTDFYAGELAYIEHDLKRAEQPQQTTKIVYNTAQSGTSIGRKSLIPAYCALRNIRICNSDAYTVSLTRQKFHVHAILQRVGLPVARTWLFRPNTGWLGSPPPPDLKVIAKAAYESASIGLTSQSVGWLDEEYERMLRAKCESYRQPFIVQEFIDGYEVEVPLIDLNRMRAVDVASVELDGSSHLGSKVLDNDIVEEEAYRYVPSEHLPIELQAELKTSAERAADVLGFRGIGRVDFRLDQSGRPYITDVATSPHMIPHAAFAQAFLWNGFDHSEVLASMIGANFRHWPTF